MKKLSAYCLFLALSQLTLSAQALPMDFQILVCGTVSVSTNTGRPGEPGATVVTTFLETERTKFRLLSVDSAASDLIAGLKAGDQITLFGVTVLEVDSSGKQEFITNPDGSIDLKPGFYKPGCHPRIN